jgi:signal transduction histidine kinase
MTLDFAERPPPAILEPGGEMGALVRATDWGATRLGPPERWSPALQMMVRLLLANRFPQLLWWGPDYVSIYNDAYRPVLGTKHPAALGKPFKDVWPEVADVLGPMIDVPFHGGPSSWTDDIQLEVRRHGFVEETHFNFAYSPVPDDAAPGGIGGVLATVSEITEKIVGERRLAALRDLGARTGDALSVEAACAGMAEALAAHAYDAPFALIYLLDDAGAVARLVAAAGAIAGEPLAPGIVDPVAADAPWPFGHVVATHAPVTVDDLAARFSRVPPSPWSDPPQAAVVAPIEIANGLAGFLVAGASPRLRLDDQYIAFFSLAAAQIAIAVGNARAYEDQRRRAEALAQIDRAKTQFFSNVSHEFRTPLTLMLGPLEDALADEAHPLGAAQRERLELAQRNGLRLHRLVNALLDFSRVEAGRMEAVYQPTDLAAFTAEVASSFRSACEKAGLAFVVNTPPLVQPAYVDREMWEKIFLNLVANAFKFTFQGRIEVSLASEGREAVLRVADTGVGIADGELPRLFERFHRIAGAEGRTHEGTGIGLALVQELVGLHQGSIAVESRPGVGTTFTVRLPLGHAHLPVERVDRERRPGSTAVRAEAFVGEALRWLPEGEFVESALGGAGLDTREGEGRLVLLADDNADMRAYVRRLLEARGYDVVAVGDGEAAMAVLRERRPDLVLTDVMMPKLDGFGLLAAIRSDPPTASVPVILLSARAGEGATVDGLDAGADDYLVKPFAARELLARVGVNIKMAEVRRDASRALSVSEQRRRLSEDRLSLAVATGRIAVFEWDVGTDRLIIDGSFNARAGEARGGAAETTLTDWLTRVHPDDVAGVRDAVRRSVETRSPYEATYRLVGPSRERTLMGRGEMRSTPEGAMRMTGAVVDITDVTAAQRALEELNATLEQRVETEVRERARAEEALRQVQKMEAVGQLTGGVAHDFNNLLTVIIGGLDTIRRSRPDDHQRIARATDMALQGAQRAVSLTSRLLAFSRRQPLEPKALDPDGLVRGMSDMLRRTLGERIELTTELHPQPWRIEADQGQLESAILNLAVNARDAMPDGGRLTIETTNVELDGLQAANDVEVTPGRYGVISVSDTGEGMSSETLERAFEPFFTTKDPGRGTGLGLSMVYGFVKQSGGHVAIESEVGRGTTVKLFLPTFEGPPPIQSASHAVAAPAGRRNEIVLFVEDDDDVRAYGVTMFKELGYQVLEATDADAALDMLRTEERIDLLFTDVVLPGKSGRELAELSTSIRPGLKVLYATGYSRDAIVHHGRLDPGVSLMTKPYTFDQLAARVRETLDRA